MRRMLMAVLDPSFVDDRDYYGNKRLELAGRFPAAWGRWPLLLVVSNVAAQGSCIQAALLSE